MSVAACRPLNKSGKGVAFDCWRFSRVDSFVVSPAIVVPVIVDPASVIAFSMGHTPMHHHQKGFTQCRVQMWSRAGVGRRKEVLKW